jgi:hypothetical protein
VNRWLALASVTVLAGCVHGDRPASRTVMVGNPPVAVTFMPPEYLPLPPGSFPYREHRKTLTFKSDCVGTCRKFWFQVDSEGLALFRDENPGNSGHDPDFKFTSEQFLAFEAALAPYQPKGEKMVFEETPFCDYDAPSVPSLYLSWTIDDEPSDMLNFEHGCTVVEHAALQEALMGALKKLPGVMALVERMP